MAQDSGWWDGTTVGDAASTDVYSAPYSSEEYANWMRVLLTSNNAKGYVMPGMGSDLAITANSPAAMNVLVANGAAFVRGRLYRNTATETLTIDAADATNPRIDRIILRMSLDSSVQTIRLAVLKGTAAATPALPTLTQNTTTWEVSLAYVWVGAAVTSITATNVHDERVFAPNLEGLLSGQFQTNQIANSEFMAFSRLDSSGGTDQGCPDGGWVGTGTVASWASVTRPSQMSRGRGIRVTTGAGNSGLRQTIRVRASTMYAIKGLVQVTAGDVASIGITTNSASPGTVIKLVRRTGAWIEYLIYYTTEADASAMTLSLLGLNNGDIIDFGQWIIVEGYNPGPFRQIHETILFDHLLSDPDFDGDTFAAVTNTTTTIDLDSDYQGIILPGTKAINVHVQMSSTDTGSVNIFEMSRVGSSTYYVAVSILGLISNNTTYFTESWVPIDPDMQIDFYVNVGGGTMTLGVYIKGIVT